MPDVGRILREEISRLAKKEAKALIEPLAKQVRDLRFVVQEQKKQISELGKSLPKGTERKSREQTTRQPTGQEEVKSVRISAGSIKKHRGRLALSQKEMGLLLDVSSVTIGSWEAEKSSPRGQNRQAFVELRKMSASQARERLMELEKTAG